ncbi:MAG: hypothetical protein CM1200mP36_00200 [Gammaproteobacteria bacterium]|nr:MAG: hypothetical protein CM1200mP36_00200 [Gammaproteobacteria bacterium]
MGLDPAGNPKESYEAGIDPLAGHTVFAEGSRGHPGRQLIERFKLDGGTGPQHYALGLKELWEIPPRQHEVARLSWCWVAIDERRSGGFFLYHAEDFKVVVG